MTMNVRALTKTVITMPTPTLVNGVPQAWTPTSVTTTAAGFIVIAMGPQGSSMTDVTYYRGVPTKLNNYSFIDPFTYGSAVITFPQITIFDDLDGLGFLGTEDNPANVDIYWYTAVPGSDFIDPMTQQRTLTYGTGTKLWEGFVASREIVGDEDSSSLQVQCQGALFQLDGYKQKPFYPRRPYVLERLMFEMLYPYYEPGNQGHPWAKPSLRTLPLTTRFPAAWTKKTPPRKEGEPDLFTPVIPPDRLWTGYTTRNTGTWEASLTGYIQEMLAVMYTTDDSGVTAGNQWALRCVEGRAPVLEIRDRNRTPDFELWVGTPGVAVNVTNDLTTKENSIYGEGTGTDGTLWRNSFFFGAWNSTDYEPLAAIDEVHPAIPTGHVPPWDEENASFDPNIMVRESKTQFGSGMTLEAATSSSEKRLESVKEAGLSGTLSLRCDPSALTRFQIQAGMTVKLKGLKGSGATGINFHIAEVVINMENLTVECKIDTKYRDLLTLEEARARTIDPMTPSKLLQVNKRSLTVEDILAPWDYAAGSGYIPKWARYGKNKKEGQLTHYNFFNEMTPATKFPWNGEAGGQDWTGTHRPGSYTPSYTGTGAATPRNSDYHRGPYVWCDASHNNSERRWAVVPVITAQKGTIRKIEMCAYDVNGNRLEVEYHVSFYYAFVQGSDMPFTGSNYSPFVQGHFEEITTSGTPTETNQRAPGTFIIGWGNADQRAGYSPGLYSTGSAISGRFVDEGTWTFDNSDPDNNQDFLLDEGTNQRSEAITLWCAIYCEHDEDVYFLGRMYKQHQEGL